MKRRQFNNPDPVDAILEYVKSRGSIANRDCRQLLDFSYDRTIFLLGGLCTVGLLVRKGVASGTHYVLSGLPVSAEALAKFKDELMKRQL